MQTTKKVTKAVMSNVARAIVSKDTTVFLLLIDVLRMCSPPWQIKTDSNQLININMIYENLGVKYLMLFPRYMLKVHINLVLERSMFSNRFVKIPHFN